MKILAIDPGTTESAALTRRTKTTRVNKHGTVYTSSEADGLTAQQRYYRRHREKKTTASRAYRKAHLAETAARMREYRRKKPELFKKYEARRKRPHGFRTWFNNYKKRWSQQNPDKRLAAYQKRRALASAAISSADLIQLRNSQNGLCAYCVNPLDNRGRGHLDHKTPLSRDGSHELSNVCFACSSCNLRKGTKTAEEFTTGASNGK